MTVNEDWSSMIVVNNKQDEGLSFIIRFDCNKEIEKVGEEKCKEAFEEMVFELRRAIDDRFGIIKK